MPSNQSSQLSSPGQRFRDALQQEQPLQIPGVINAYTALQATELGFKALYLSGAGVANASYGLPDLGMTQLPDVLTDVNRITSVTDLPLLVDIDTGWGHAFTIARTIKQMIKAGAAAVHMEDQINAKRCGHRPGKILVAADEMCDRIKAAVDARTDEQFVIMARTDAAAVEGVDAAIERAKQYVAAGADMIFAEALTEAEHFKHFTSNVPVPVLANMTEFGKSPLLTTSQLAELGIAMALYPLSAFRAMSQAALQTLSAIRQQGSQQSVIDKMQTRDELYATLQYKKFEKKLDRIFSEE